MRGTRLLAVVLIVAGILALAYGGFSYQRDATVVKVGPIELSAKKTETIDIPMWAGIAAIAVGGVLLVVGGRKG